MASPGSLDVKEDLPWLHLDTVKVSLLETHKKVLKAGFVESVGHYLHVK